jgi:hypothetical protein
MANFHNAHSPAGLQNATLESLAQIAKHSNLLAKQLDGSFRLDLYRLKSEACSILLLKRWAVVNGVRADNTLCLTILTEVQVRVHVPRFTLSPEAQVIVREQSRKIPAVASIAEHLAARAA